MYRATAFILTSSILLAVPLAVPPAHGQSFSLGLENQMPVPEVHLRTREPVDLGSTDRGPIALAAMPRRTLADLGGLFRSASRPSAENWKHAGFALSAIGLLASLDEPIKEWTGANRTDVVYEISEAVRPIGQEAGLALLAGTWAAGRAFHKPRWVMVSQDALEASVIASGVLAPALKSIAGRTRPRDTDETGAFTAFSGEQSFPSGEATQAFAIASVVAAHSQSRWVDGLSYGLAAFVAAQRIGVDAHWTSDVVAGAVLGTVVGRWIVRRHSPAAFEPLGERAAGRWAIAPSFDSQTQGIGLRVRWTR